MRDVFSWVAMLDKAHFAAECPFHSDFAGIGSADTTQIPYLGAESNHVLVAGETMNRIRADTFPPQA